MKEACVGQWSLGTLVPVCACVDVSVYWMCLWRRPEKCVKGGGHVEKGGKKGKKKGEMTRPYCII